VLLVIAMYSVAALRLRALAVDAGVDTPLAYQTGGPAYDVGSAELTLHDDAREKKLEVKVYYPEAASAQTGAESRARFPLIVFSHGAGGDRYVANGLLSFWAAHGYVVVAPTHEDSISLRLRGGESASMKDVLRKFGTDPQLRIGCVLDDKLILDRLDDIEYELPDLDGRIDASRIGIAGHSAGAMTTALMAGTRCDMPVNGPGGPETAGLAELRASAFLVLSGQGCGGAFDEHSWDDITRPMMVMTGSLDTSARTGETPESRCDPYTYAPPGDKYLLFIEGAAHMSFTGKAAGQEGPGRGRLLNSALGADQALLDQIDDYDQAAIFACVQQSSLAFWDAYLKSDARAKQYLSSDNIGKLGNPLVKYSLK
jgi:predicted dienelactone hydrolase